MQFSLIVEDLLIREKHAILELLKCADGSSWNPKQACLSGTRVELINDLLDFASSPAPPPYRIQLVIGVLGCGKTAIAHSVAELCHNANPRVLGAAFMFSREAETRSTPDLLMSSIASTLCGRYPALARATSAAIENDRSILLAPIARQFRSLLLEPLKAACHSILYPIAIIIDALDEACNDGSDAELLEVLGKDCAELPPNVRIIITSRPSPQIMMHLAHQPHIRVREIELLSTGNLGDIALFAQHSLAMIAEKRFLGSWPGKHLTEAFVLKAEGLFIWVSTTCGFMLKATSPTRQLERLLGSDSSLKLSSEAKMAQLYTTVLATCPWDDEDFADNYQVLMGTILTLRTPLSPEGIKSLLGIDLSITDTLRSLSPVLTGVTDSQDEHRPVQILHDSFRGYLTLQHGSALNAEERRYKIDVAAHNQRLLLNILSLLDRELGSLAPFINHVVSVLWKPEIRGLPVPPHGTISEAVWYCCQHIVSHLSAVKAHGVSPKLLEALENFTETQRLGSWILLGSSNGSFQGPSALLNWFPVCLPVRYLLT